MTTPDPLDRATLSARLRHMADWLDAHPGIPVTPYAAVIIHYFPADADAINAVQHAALDSHWEREGKDWDILSYYVDGDRLGPWTVEYRLSFEKHHGV